MSNSISFFDDFILFNNALGEGLQPILKQPVYQVKTRNAKIVWMK